MSSAEYYDEFGPRQAPAGINARHRAIAKWLRRFGLRRGMDVLELGCGIGSVTTLVRDVISDAGTLVAVDISPRSIELARDRLGARANVEFIVGDIVELDLDRTFDVVVLPDVLEHVPIELHPKLFGNVRRWLRDTGWVLVHMPNPFFLEWCRRHRPDLLQEIDQPLHLQALVDSVEPNDLYIRHLQTYSIWVGEGDYQALVLKPRPRDDVFHAPMDCSVRARAGRSARRLLGGRGR